MFLSLSLSEGLELQLEVQCSLHDCKHLCVCFRCPFLLPGPFYCALSEVSVALTSCAVSPALIIVSELVTLTELDAVLGYIDPTSHMKDSRVFLISGTKDTTIKQG